jgi:hypothetical protein
MLELIHEATGDTALAHKYNRHYIGLAREGAPDSFIRHRQLNGRSQQGIVNLSVGVCGCARIVGCSTLQLAFLVTDFR